MTKPRIVLTDAKGNGVDAPNVGMWDTAPSTDQRREVDFERTAVLYTPDGRALVRRAGF
jgi:hypothetical protein